MINFKNGQLLIMIVIYMMSNSIFSAASSVRLAARRITPARVSQAFTYNPSSKFSMQTNNAAQAEAFKSSQASTQFNQSDLSGKPFTTSTHELNSKKWSWLVAGSIAAIGADLTYENYKNKTSQAVKKMNTIAENNSMDITQTINDTHKIDDTGNNQHQKPLNMIIPAQPIIEQQYQELTKFIQKYKPSKAIEKQLEIDNKEILNKGCEISRIINAERMKKVFKLNNLDLLKVPDKYFTKMLKKNRSIDGVNGKPSVNVYEEKWSVAAKKVNLKKLGKLSLREVQQIVTFAEKTGFSDWGARGSSINIMRDQDNKLVFIDTEDKSFEVRQNKNTYTKAECLDRLYAYYNFMDEDAQAWFKARDNDNKNSAQKAEQLIPLSRNNEYDDTSLNMENAKQEYDNYYDSIDFKRIGTEIDKAYEAAGSSFELEHPELSQNLTPEVIKTQRCWFWW